MAEGGPTEELRRSTLMGSEDGDLSYSIMMGSDDGDLSYSMMMGSQDVHEYYCEPCDKDDIHVEATFYCKTCTEYLCKKCSVSHKKIKQSRDHDILDVQYMAHKPPVGKKQPIAVTMATHVKDIKVKDEIISSALMSTNQLLVADRYNKTGRLVDIVSYRQVSELTLSGWPWQVARISDIYAAVTLPYEHKIVLLKTQPQLSVVMETSVQGACYGVAYMDNKLVVTFWDGRVEILDMSGNVLRTISADQKGKKIFTTPVSVTVNPATGSMYVSDWVEEEKCKLLKLSMEGRVEATFTFTTGGHYSPRQVALDSQGMVYLGCERSRMLGLLDSHLCVEQLSANLGKVRAIISGLTSLPHALSYDEATKQLYVGQDDGVGKVYKLS